MNTLLVGLCAWMVMPLASTSWLAEMTCWPGAAMYGGTGALTSGNGLNSGLGGRPLDGTVVGFWGMALMIGICWMGAPAGGMPRMPWSVLATSSGSAYESRISSSRRGPRALASDMAASAWSFLVDASASFTSASARLVRISLSDLTCASWTRASASRSLVSCSVETMRMTLPRSIFWRPRVSRMVSRACSQVTLRKDTETLPLTSSPATILRPLSAARMRSRLTTSASLKSSEMSLVPEGAWPVGADGAPGAGGADGGGGGGGGDDGGELGAGGGPGA